MKHPPSVENGPASRRGSEAGCSPERRTCPERGDGEPGPHCHFFPWKTMSLVTVS